MPLLCSCYIALILERNFTKENSNWFCNRGLFPLLIQITEPHDGKATKETHCEESEFSEKVVVNFYHN